jgi:hypothetical protein
MNRNPYRAELYSILAALTVLLKAESRSSDYASGTATLISDIVLAPTTGKATVFFNNRVITAVLPQQIKANLHYDNLKANC